MNKLSAGPWLAGCLAGRRLACAGALSSKSMKAKLSRPFCVFRMTPFSRSRPNCGQERREAEGAMLCCTTHATAVPTGA